jgi:hypothetical protein
MAVFKYTLTLVSSSLSMSDSGGVTICRGPLPRRSPLNEMPTAVACAGMGCGTSTLPMQFQQNANRRALLRILYTKINGKYRIHAYIRMKLGNRKHAYFGERTERAVGLDGVRRVAQYLKGLVCPLTQLHWLYDSSHTYELQFQIMNTIGVQKMLTT